MKKQTLTLVIIFSLLYTKAQVPSFQWAENMGGIFGDYSLSVSLDAKSNVYTTGYFNGTSDFDPGAGIANLTSAGSNDIFISKLDAYGNFVWAKSFGGTFSDIGYAIALDAKSNVYITGNFSGTVDFDPGVGVSNLTSAGGDDVFILKLDASGNFIWAKNMGGTANDDGHSISIDTLGNVFSCGTFEGTADFDPGAAIFNLTPSGTSDMFISKLDASGNFVWAEKFGGPSFDNANAIKTDDSGNVYMTGYFQGKADFDPSPTDTFYLISAGASDIFVLKLNLAGNFTWAKNMGGTTGDEALSLAVDASGNVYTSGYFNGKADFDPGAATFYITSSGFVDAFISKLTASGNFVWAKNVGGASDDRARSLAVDNSGNIFLTGSFIGTADFDPGSSIFNLTSVGVNDIFILKLTSNGSFGWAKNMGGSTDDYGVSIAVSSFGYIYTTGTFTGTVDFDPGAGIMNLISTGNTDFFIQKMSPFGVGINEHDNANTIHISPNPNNGIFSLVLSDASNNSSIEIFNSLGELIYKQTIVNERNTINLANYSNGLYYIKIIDSENKIAAGRILKAF